MSPGSQPPSRCATWSHRSRQAATRAISPPCRYHCSAHCISSAVAARCSTPSQASRLRCGISRAKRAGQSIATLLGGARRSLLPAYASLPRYGDPVEVARHADAAAKRGYRSIKLHEIGPEEVAAARAAVGPEVDLMMDTNCPWTVEEALAIADRVRPQRLLWLEEPIWPPEDAVGLARVRAGAGIKIAAGENAASPEECIAMMDAGAVDYIQPSVTKIGGIGPWMRIAGEAATRGVTVMPHSPYFGAGLLATLHMAAALTGDCLVEHMYRDLAANPFAAALQPRGDSFILPEGPGLGCEPDPEVLRRYAAW
jgi:D-galactarolactone cycloisomerase